MKTKISTMLLFGMAAVVAVVLYTVMTHNQLIQAEENAATKWAQVDNQLKRRADLIPNLVETVKGYAAHEKEAIEAVSNARNRVASATTSADLIQSNWLLTGALGSFRTAFSGYPELRANEQFKQLMDSLEGTENRLAVARRDYNEAAAAYNSKRRQFPGNVLASVSGLEPKPYYEASERERETPVVNFGGAKP
ncbi:LemA family protein [Paenibacillus hodogayensis]|uniref:LemA family protein n=1 Tax=Paenibacillus hodogayensis TaxID=279208 RepID=A0ABV5VVR6_9BACL